jgi:hypothetical protein
MRKCSRLSSYFIAHNYDPGPLSLDSIVCTPEYHIKFLDTFLHHP